MVKTIGIAGISFLAHLSVYAQVNYEWAKGIGGSGFDRAIGMDMDEYGNIYMVGTFDDTVDFDPGPEETKLISQGEQDIFFAKYDVSGNLLWCNGIGSSGWLDFATSVKVDKNNDLYVSGFFENIVDFDPGPGVANRGVLGGVQCFLAKYDSIGNYMWAYATNAGFDDVNHAIGIDSEQNLYLAGYFYGTQDFDFTSGIFNLTSAASEDIFIGKYSPSGNLIWAKDIPGKSKEFPSSMDVDGSGNIYITGQFFDTTDFDPSINAFNLTSNGSSDIFIAKYDSGGNFIWAKNIGGNGYEMPSHIHIGNFGKIYVTGDFHDTVDFDPGIDTTILISNFNLPSYANGDIFISQFDTEGNFYWVNHLGSDTFAWSSSIQENLAGDVYLLGAFMDTVDFDPGPDTLNLIASTSSSTYLTSYHQNGDFIWAGIVGGGYSLEMYNGDFFVSGDFSGTSDFDPNASIANLISYGSSDACIAKYSNEIPTANQSVNDQLNNILIYPNPTSNTIKFELPFIPTTIAIFNLLGEKMIKEKVSGDNVTIDVSELPAGLYIAQTSEGTMGKFVKK